MDQEKIYINSSEYRNAFVQYLRRGIAINIEKKGLSNSYIWHTRGDEKVRSSHSQNDGKIFSYDDPPSTGNPGSEFGCRCWAEPIGKDMHAEQTQLTEVDGGVEKWTNADLTARYLGRSGEGVTLTQIGYLQDVIDFYADGAVASDGSAGIYRRVNQQIIDAARETSEGSFIYDFENVYDFQDGVLFALGNSTVSGLFIGNVRKEKDFLVIDGFINYDLFDEYSDPLSFVEGFVDVFGAERQDAEQSLGGGIIGADYPITGSWQTKFNATVKVD